ncbi:acetylornithine aminotransferase [Natronocella acetinitrilica]|uniref:Acetylornithine aminotransferase n=1 Tax=Natronocella acetinitrilica TaxID=414046 RepID=A0AAE3G8F6_9GAMM|nr:acetylornithine transaminase [Natronocella acetinitrilica]MCP1676706.1 acetylornithine aminotransferase [Natronocella acetinitrilica]
MQQALMQTYGRLPVSFQRGEGAWLWDDQGNRYLDALSGIAVCGLGHAHPAVTAAIQKQAARLLHTSNLYGIPLQEHLAAALCAHSGMGKVFFCNSGAEANEAAIKLARFHGHQRGLDVPKIVVMENAFHGRTMATLTATGNRKAQQGFGPLLEGFVRIPYDDLKALDKLATTHDDIIAVLVEPVQGEGGIRVPGPDYLPGLRDRCDEHGWLLMLDEVQSGMARTGRWFAYQHADVLPDVLSLAKGLANGVPIGACLARGAAANVMQPGSHGSTFGGNPLAAAAAQAVVDTIAKQSLTARAAQLGQRLLVGFRDALESHSGVVDVRGRGLMIGIELDRPCAELVKHALERGLLINVTAGNVIRLLPPLILSDAEADELLERVNDLVLGFLAEGT